jgi:hypothetical protein
MTDDSVSVIAVGVLTIGPADANGVRELTFYSPRCTKWHDKICRISIVHGEPQKPCHGWDGNEAEPTITPSIGCEPRGCAFHGHIKKGRVE